MISSVTQLCLTSCNCMNCRMPGFLVHHQLLEHTQTHVHSVSDAIQPAHPLSPPCPTFNLFQYQSIFKSQFFASDGQRFGSSASASILPMNISGLISFRMDWLDLLPVQETLKSLQHHSSKVSILQHSAFFIFQPSHRYKTTGISCWDAFNCHEK